MRIIDAALLRGGSRRRRGAFIAGSSEIHRSPDAPGNDIGKAVLRDVVGRLLDPAPKAEVAFQPQRDSLMRLFNSLMARFNTLFG